MLLSLNRTKGLSVNSRVCHFSSINGPKYIPFVPVATNAGDSLSVSFPKLLDGGKTLPFQLCTGQNIASGGGLKDCRSTAYSLVEGTAEIWKPLSGPISLHSPREVMSAPMQNKPSKTPLKLLFFNCIFSPYATNVFSVTSTTSEIGN